MHGKYEYIEERSLAVSAFQDEWMSMFNSKTWIKQMFSKLIFNMSNCISLSLSVMYFSTFSSWILLEEYNLEASGTPCQH